MRLCRALKALAFNHRFYNGTLVLNLAVGVWQFALWHGHPVHWWHPLLGLLNLAAAGMMIWGAVEGDRRRRACEAWHAAELARLDRLRKLRGDDP